MNVFTGEFNLMTPNVTKYYETDRPDRKVRNRSITWLRENKKGMTITITNNEKLIRIIDLDRTGG